MKKYHDKTLIFDLDETLIHATKTQLNIPESFVYKDYFVYKRPGLEHFLSICDQLCSIAIWSSAEDEYVKAITKHIFGNTTKPKFVWGRSACWLKVVKVEDPSTGLRLKQHQYIKPLEKVCRKGYVMHNLLIIDDSLYKVKDNPDNYLIIPPFEGNPQDEELNILLDYLKGIISVEDFRSIKKNI